MSNITPTISIRLPDVSRRNLDKAAKLTRRSRSYLMKEALDRHLAQIVTEETTGVIKTHLSGLLKLSGVGANKTKPRSAKEIDHHIKWLRDNG